MRGIFFILVSAFVFFCSTDASRDVPARKRLGQFPPNNRRAFRPVSDLRPPPPRGVRHQQPLIRSNPYENHQGARRPQPAAQKRVLVLPVISEGYASTSFQGGASRRSGVDNVATKVLDATPIYTNDIAAIPPPAKTTTTSTTARTTTTAPTTTTSRAQREKAIREEQLKKSEEQRLKLHLQELENLKAQRNKDTFSVQVTSSLGGGNRVPPLFRRPKPTDAGIKGSVEKVSPFVNGFLKRRRTTTTTVATTTTTVSSTTTTQSPFILQPGEAGAFGKSEAAADVIVNPKEYVRFIASPPKQINIAIPSNGKPSGQPPQPVVVSKPPGKDDSLIYQQGFQQQVSANRGDPTSQTVLGAYNHEPKGWPISPLDAIKQDNEGNYYPLGKPPPKHENRLPRPPGNRKPVRKPGVPFPKPSAPKKKVKPTSFFDFLIPSFLSRSSDDDEGVDGEDSTSQKAQQTHLLEKLPVPTRPPNTFPQADALGGRLNPIRIKVPSGFNPNGPPPAAFPKPPTLEDWQKYQQRTLTHRSNQFLFQHHAADPRTNGLLEQAEGRQKPILPRMPPNPPQLAKLASRNRVAEGPIAMAGRPRVPARRKQGSLAGQRRQPSRTSAAARRPMPRIEKEPWTEALAAKAGSGVPLAPSERESIKAKLRDPDFMMSLTQAYVYHDEDPSNGLGEGGVTYVIPNADPFAFKPDPLQIKQSHATSSGLHEIEFQSRIGQDAHHQPLDIPEIFNPEDNVVYKPIETRKPRPAPTKKTTTTTKPMNAASSKFMKKFLANPDAAEITPSQMHNFDAARNVVLMGHPSSGKGSDLGKYQKEVGSEDQLRDRILNDDGFATYLTHLDESLLSSMASEARNAIPSGGPNQPEFRTEALDRVFEPSMPPGKSDWFVLNEKGQRERPMSEGEIEDVIELIDEHSAVSGEGAQPAALLGGFFPSSGPQ